MTSTPTRSCCRSGKAFRSGLLFCVPTLSLLPSPLSPTSLSPSCKPAAKILLKFILLAASISMETSRNHGNHLNWAKRFQNCCTRLLIFPPLNLFLCTSVYLHIMNTFTVRVCLLHLFFFFLLGSARHTAPAWALMGSGCVTAWVMSACLCPHPCGPFERSYRMPKLLLLCDLPSACSLWSRTFETLNCSSGGTTDLTAELTGVHSPQPTPALCDRLYKRDAKKIMVWFANAAVGEFWADAKVALRKEIWL